MKSAQKYQMIRVEPMVFPPIVFWAFASEISVVQLDGFEYYKKKSYRNRYMLGSIQGIQEMSIPLVKGKNKEMIIQQVRIYNNQHWAQIHWKTIQSLYGKSPFFKYYQNEIRDLLCKPCEYLFEFHQRTLKEIANLIRLPIVLTLTDHYNPVNEDSTLDIRNTIELNSLRSADIFPGYFQVFQRNQKFIPDLSILDLLFHMGPESSLYLSKVYKNIENQQFQKAIY